MKTSKLTKLRRKTYRDAYVRAHLQQGIAYQIREMRVSRGLTQSQLAKALKLGGQSAVARLEDPSYGRMSLPTLLKVAAFFDVALLTKMVPYTKFLAEVRDVSPQSMVAESFESEDAAGALENAPEFHLERTIQPSSSGMISMIGAWHPVTAVVPGPSGVSVLPYAHDVTASLHLNNLYANILPEEPVHATHD